MSCPPDLRRFKLSLELVRRKGKGGREEDVVAPNLADVIRFVVSAHLQRGNKFVFPPLAVLKQDIHLFLPTRRFLSREEAKGKMGNTCQGMTTGRRPSKRCEEGPRRR